MSKNKKSLTIILKLPGVVACGEYKANTKYTVEYNEAMRLINVKGFEETTKK